MANRQVLFDDVEIKYKLGGTPLAQPTDEDFDIGVGGATEVVTTAAFTAEGKIDVFVNGKLEREGASLDFTRNAGLKKILFNYTVPENAWVRVRLW